MPSTYTPIATTTLGSDSTSVSFSSLSSTYTDIIAIISGTYSVADTTFRMRFNDDTGSNYSVTVLYGNGSAAGSYRNTNQTFIDTGWYPYPSAEAQTGNAIVHVQNYANSTTYKTTLQRGNSAGGQGVSQSVGLWRSTSAINKISFTISSGNFKAGSTFTLYGVKSA